MVKINEIEKRVEITNDLLLEDIPNIDLYMDQVIQLFENQFNSSKRNENEKILTKTMINNYAKGKLLFPIKNKKYSKEHIIMIAFIYQLKGGLSINDIKATLDKLNDKVEDHFNLDQLYTSYLELSKKNNVRFQEDIFEIANEVSEEIHNEKNEGDDYLEQLLMITSLINMSNLYRKAAEKIVDRIVQTNEAHNKNTK